MQTYRLLLLAMLLSGNLNAAPLSMLLPYTPFSPKRVLLNTQAGASFSMTSPIQTDSFGSPAFHSRLFYQRQLNKERPLIFGIDYDLAITPLSFLELGQKEEGVRV